MVGIIKEEAVATSLSFGGRASAATKTKAHRANSKASRIVKATSRNAGTPCFFNSPNDSQQSALYDGGEPSPEGGMTGITVGFKPTVVKGDICCAGGTAREAIASAIKFAAPSALPHRFRRPTGLARGYAHKVTCGTMPSRICE